MKTMKIVEERQKFLDYVFSVVQACSQMEDRKRVAQLTAFSILAAIDGEAIPVGLGPYELRPINESGDFGPDIAGSLNDDFSKMHE